MIAKCTLRREDRVDATAKVGPPLTEKLFISKSTREETAVPTSPVECIMQRLFEVRPFRPFSRRLVLLFLLLFLPRRPSLFSLLFALFRREAALANYIAGEMLLARREDLERRIFRDTKGNVSRRSGLIIRFRGAD